METCLRAHCKSHPSFRSWSNFRPGYIRKPQWQDWKQTVGHAHVQIGCNYNPYLEKLVWNLMLIFTNFSFIFLYFVKPKLGCICKYEARIFHRSVQCWDQVFFPHIWQRVSRLSTTCFFFKHAPSYPHNSNRIMWLCKLSANCWKVWNTKACSELCKTDWLLRSRKISFGRIKR